MSKVSAGDPQRRLGAVLLHQHLWLLAMLLLTAMLGAVWIYAWQQASNESLRINSMMRDAQQLYRDVYRQAREASIASQTSDGMSVTQYWEHIYDMDARFDRLEQQLRQAGERNALAGMRHAYVMMQTQINVLLSERAHQDSYKLIDTAVERWITGMFADAYSGLSRVLDNQHQVVSHRLRRWNSWALWLFPLPLIASILLVLFTHRRLKRIFSYPMQSLSEGAIEIARGHLDYRVPETGVAETHSLAASINQMATDLSQAREQLLEQERKTSLKRLVPIVAHNIRNPLASIRALAQAAHPEDDLTEREETRRAIIATVDRLERWTASLLNYLNPFTPIPACLNVSSLISGLTDMARPQAQIRGIEIKLHVPYDLTLQADPNLLEQALHGLLINALEASPRDSTVHIRAESSSGTIDIHIDDEGPGIPFVPDTQRAGPRPTTKTHGTGIGIPFALRVCQAHGGKLLFAKSPSNGTRVTTQLPKQDGEMGADE
jgi:signal transduction histidine kinase